MTTRSTAQEILSLTATLPDRFTAISKETNHIGTVYGGRLIGQALAAAVRTVQALPVSSLHAYFLASASASTPLEYRVERLRDSRRFANRLVTVHQNETRVFVLTCEFHAPEPGFDHQSVRMPDVPPPEAVPSLQDFVCGHADRLHVSAVRNFSGALPVEMRAIEPETYFFRRPDRPVRNFWLRLPSAATIDDPRQQQCLLAYAGDYWLAGVAATPHAFPTNGDALLISSLDHAMWFHRPARCDDWLLYHTVSPSAQDGLGLSHGYIFDRAGRLVASTAQESLLRRMDPVAGQSGRP